MAITSSKIQYRRDIQGLRAIAVSLVVFAHASVPGFAGGFVGVDVFFVLSGYLITGLLVREHAMTGRIRYVAFLAQRLKRLLPALLTMLVLVLGAAAVMLSAYEMRMQSGSFLFAATWTSNFFFAFVDRDYFSALQSEDLFLHTWSLGVEEQFYLVWPWLISLVFVLTLHKADADRARKTMLGIFLAVFSASLLLCLYWSKTQALLPFYMMPSRGWQFALGAAVFVWFHPLRGQPQSAGAAGAPPAPGLLTGAAGLLLIVGSVVLLTPELTYPGYLALFPSFGAALVIAAGVRSATGVSGVIAHRYLVWLGDRSYSLYLWHWPVFILGRSYGLADTAAGIAVLISISLTFAALSFKLIELPFWKGQFSQAKPTQAIVVSALMAVAVIGLSESLKHSVYGVPTETTKADGYDPRLDALPGVYTVGLNCDTGHFNAFLIPCPIGARDGESLAVLMGDSIGAQWSSLVSGIFPAPGWQIIVLTKSACAMVDEDYYYDKVGADYDVCTEWRNAAIDYIGELEPDVVVVGSSADYPFSRNQWVDGTARVLGQLAAAANEVIVIPGTPKLTFDGPSCLEEPYRFSLRLADSARECEEAQHATTNIEVANYLEVAAGHFGNVSVLNVGDLVCPNRRCSASTEDGLAIFRDSQHLTMSFVDSLIPDTRERLVSMGVLREAQTSGLIPTVTSSAN